MKKQRLMIISGIIFLVLQFISVIADVISGTMEDTLKNIATFGAGYAISYFAAGLIGAVLVSWGIISAHRAKGE